MKQNKISNYLKEHMWLVLSVFLLTAIAIAYYVLLSHVNPTPDAYARRYSNELGYRIKSISDVLYCTWNHYTTENGRLFTAFYEYFFLGLLKNRVWYKVATTCIFIIFLLIANNLYIKNRTWNSGRFYSIALFFCCFWFLCPVPDEVLFGMVCSMDYLWMDCACIIWLSLYFYFREKDSSTSVKIGLALLSFYLGVSETMAIIGICGALVCYYIFHTRELKGDALPMIIGFIIGSLVLLFGPGNFVRYFTEQSMMNTMWSGANVSSGFHLGRFIQQLTTPFANYKVVWILVLSGCIFLIKDRHYLLHFCKDNIILLLVVFWNIIAYSIVFKGTTITTRALLFEETISLVLIFKLLLPKIQNQRWLRISAVVLLVLVSFDYANAYKEMVRIEQVYSDIKKDIRDNNGEICFEDIKSKHRCVEMIFFEEWCYLGLKLENNVDTIIIHPLLFCDVMPEDNVCVTENQVAQWLYRDNDWYIVRLPIDSVENEEMNCVVSYKNARREYRDIAQKIGIYRYDKKASRSFPQADVKTDKFYYYFIRPFGESDKQILSLKVLGHE